MQEVKFSHTKLFGVGNYTLLDLVHLLDKPERTVRNQIEVIGLEPNEIGVYSEYDYAALKAWDSVKPVFRSLQRYRAWLRQPVNPSDPNSPVRFDFLPQELAKAEREAKRKKKNQQQFLGSIRQVEQIAY